MQCKFEALFSQLNDKVVVQHFRSGFYLVHNWMTCAIQKGSHWSQWDWNRTWAGPHYSENSFSIRTESALPTASDICEQAQWKAMFFHMSWELDTVQLASNSYMCEPSLTNGFFDSEHQQEECRETGGWPCLASICIPPARAGSWRQMPAIKEAISLQAVVPWRRVAHCLTSMQVLQAPRKMGQSTI